MKGVITWFAGHPVAANLLVVAVVSLGLRELPTLQQEVVPTVLTDSVQITVPYPGAAPEEVEQSICARIEESVQGLSGVEEVTSSATESLATVTVDLLFGTDRNTLLADIQSAVDRIDSFPEEAERPTVSLVDLNSSAMKVVIWGPTDGLTLRALALRLQAGLVSLPEISLVRLVNAAPLEISIEVAEADLRRFSLSFDEVAEAVRRSSVDLPGGSIKTQGGEILLRSEGRALRGAAFSDLPLRTRPDGTHVLLGDVATIRDGLAETDQAMRFNGNPAAAVDIFRVGDQQALVIGPAARRYLDGFSQSLPEGLEVAITADETVMLEDRLNLMLDNGLQGLALVLITLALFLRLRLAMWVTIGIPISFLGGIWLMPAMDVSVNMISLFAFIIVLGIVVDDAIVVAENIHHHRHNGEGRKSGLTAAILGTHQVSKPVIFAVLTTMVAFTPMLFMPGNMGQFSRNIPLVVIAVLVFSLVESLLVLPAHLKHLPSQEQRASRGILEWIQSRTVSGLDRFILQAYTPALRALMRYRYATLTGGVGLLVVSVTLISHGWLKFNFFPQIEADNVAVELTMPLGTPKAHTLEALRGFEQAAQELAAELENQEGGPVVESIMTSLGGQPYREKQSKAAAGVGTRYSGGHLGEVNVALVPAEERGVSSRQFADLWDARTQSVPGAESLVFSSQLMGGDGDIHIRLSGQDSAELSALGAELQARMGELVGVSAVRDNFVPGKRELSLSLKPAGLAAGLTHLDLARQVRQAFYGVEVQSIQRGRDELKVYVRYSAQERMRMATLGQMRIQTQGGLALPFSEVARVQHGVGYAAIHRAGRARFIDIVADIDSGVTTPGIVETSLRSTVLPDLLEDHPQVTSSFEGPQKEQRQFMGAMRTNAISALLAMFVLLAIPLRSYLRPFVIMLAIPFGLIGALWGHMLMGFDFSMFSVIGIMALTGIVVNDSLVLVDYIEGLRSSDGIGAAEAVLRGGQRRFRAIFLTTLTTFAGLTPLLLEQSVQARFMIPMAVSLAFGVVFATVITLLLIPAFYLILEDLKELAGRWMHRLTQRRPSMSEGAGSCG